MDDESLIIVENLVGPAAPGYRAHPLQFEVAQMGTEFELIFASA